MRPVPLAVLALTLSPAALAADFDPGPLRGTEFPVPVLLWNGPYVGGFGGVSQSNFEFKNAFRDVAAGLSNVRDTLIETEYGVSKWLVAPRGKDAHAATFGGFAGVNAQYEDVVFGFEADYTHTGLKGTRTDSISRFVTLSNGYFNDAVIAGSASTELRDYGTVRVRAGYTSGPFLPFVTAGIALGQVRTSTSVTAQIAGYDTAAYNLWVADPITYPAGSINRYGYSAFNPANLAARQLAAGVTGSVSKSTVAAGFTAGAGLDIAVGQNIFLRAEYQYAWFDDFNGHKLNVNTIRGGGGVKF